MSKPNVLLLQFPKYICLSVLTEWISNLDLLLLDTAVCNKHLRTILLNIFNCESGAVFYVGSEWPMNWLYLRKINVSHFSLHNYSAFNTWTPSETSATTSIYEYLWRSSVKTDMICNKCFDFQKLSLSTTRLTAFNLSKCFLLPDEALMKMTSICVNLISLDLADCDLISDTSLTSIVTNNHNLQNINLANCTLITDVTIIAIATNCASLNSLNLHNCFRITPLSVISIGNNHCQNSLTSLDISLDSDHQKRASNHCAENPIIVSHIEQLIVNCHALQYLNIDRSISVEKTTTDLLALHCTDLRSLIISRISPNCRLGELTSHCPHMHTLHIDDCYNLRDQQVVSFLISCNNLTDLKLCNAMLMNDTYRTIAVCGTKLISLNLQNRPIFGTIDCLYVILASCNANLLSLTLGGNFILLNSISEHCSNLTTLDLSKVDSVYNYVNKPTLHTNTKLTTLLLSQTNNNTPKTCALYLDDILNSYHHIHTISIDTYESVIGKIAERYKQQLTDLTMCSQSVSENELNILSTHCKKLQKLNLRGCSFDKTAAQTALCNVFKTCTKLRRLDLSGTNVSQSTVLKIKQYCSVLSYLNLCDCDKITPNTVKMLKGCVCLRYVVTGDVMRGMQSESVEL